MAARAARGRLLLAGLGCRLDILSGDLDGDLAAQRLEKRDHGLELGPGHLGRGLVGGRHDARAAGRGKFLDDVRPRIDQRLHQVGLGAQPGFPRCGPATHPSEVRPARVALLGELVTEEASALGLDQRLTHTDQGVGVGLDGDLQLGRRVFFRLGQPQLTDPSIEPGNQDHEAQDSEEYRRQLARRSFSSERIASAKTIDTSRKNTITMIETTIVANPWLGM